MMEDMEQFIWCPNPACDGTILAYDIECEVCGFKLIPNDE